MKNIEIKQLFTKADEQICVGESKNRTHIRQSLRKWKNKKSRQCL